MNQHKDLAYWKKRKAEADRAVKLLAQKRENTLYLYEVEKQARRKTKELQLRKLLEYETKELQQTQAALQNISEKITILEKEQQTGAAIKIVGLLSLGIVMFALVGLIIYPYYVNDRGTNNLEVNNQEVMVEAVGVEKNRHESSWTNDLFAFLKRYSFGDNVLTGAVVGISNEKCHEEIRCINETIIDCRNETVQGCDYVNCINTTSKVCAEECKPVCHIEKVNSVEREVCIKKCSEVCTEKTNENCSNCTNKVEEKCSSEIVQQCSKQTICDELENSVTGQITAKAVEEVKSQEIEILPVVDKPAEAEEGPSLRIQDITILNIKPVISSLILNTTKLATNNTRVNLTAYATASDADGDSIKIIYNWYINNTPIMVLNMPFERINGTDENNTKDYTGLNVNKTGEKGGAIWNATGGHDGKGAYKFNGLSQFISVSNESLFDLKNFTYVVWITATNNALTQAIIDVDTQKQSLGISGTSYYIFGRCGWITAGTVKLGIPTMLAWSINGTEYQLYENATRIASGTGCSGGVDGNYLNIGAGSFSGTDGFGDSFYEGQIDDVKVFNISLTAEQISALYYNRTYEIANTMLFPSQNWSVDATPNDGIEDGEIVFSNNVTILPNAKPIITSPFILNTTHLEKNDTTTNLTAYATASDADGDPVKIIYNWYINDTPIMVLNMPFEQINGTTQNNTLDYTGMNMNKTNEKGGAVWNATGGHDGKGAYFFDGTSQYISVNNESLFDLKNFTYVAWIRAASTTVNQHTVLDVDTDKQALGRSGSSYAIWGRCGTVTAGTVKVDIPTMLAWSVNGTEYQLYENATLISSGTGCSGGINGDYLNIGAGDPFGGGTGDEFFDGHIDDIKVFNISLTAEQISALYYNRTYEIANTMLFPSQNWSVEATPNDGIEDGVMVTSNNVTILPARCDVTLTACKSSDWIEGSKYCLGQSITDVVGTCMSILNHSITLDCQGFAIEGDNSGTDYGVNINRPTGQFKDTTIKNCVIANFSAGILLADGNDTIINNVTFNNNTASGLDASGTRNVTVSNSIFLDHEGSSDEGILISLNNVNWNISWNNFTGNYEGIDFGTTNNFNFTIENNNFNSSTFAGITVRGDNATVRDNFFVDNVAGLSIASGTADENTFSRNQFNRSTTAAISFASANIADANQYFYDNLINGYPYVHCFNNNTYLSDNQFVDTNKITNLGAAIIFQCSYAVINNLTIKSESTSGYALHIAESNHTIVNKSAFYNNTRGIYLDNSGSDVKNLTIMNSNISNNTQSGIDSIDADNITIFNNIFGGHTGSSDEGIMISSNNVNWNISTNNFTGNYEGIDFGTTNNFNFTIENNNFNSSTFAGITVKGDNATVRDNFFVDNVAGLSIASGTADENTFSRNQFNRSTTAAISFASTSIADANQYFYDNLINGYPYVHCFNNNTYLSDNQFVDTNKITNLGAAIIFQCSYAVINNLTIKSESTSGYALRIAESNHTIVNKSVFYNNTRGIYLDNFGSDVKNLTIMNSNISNNTQSGIDGIDADNITIFNNIFESHTGSSDEGILISSNNVNWNISTNNFTGNYQAVEHRSTTNVNFTYNGNNFLSNAFEGISMSGDDNKISENTFANNTEAVDVETLATGNYFYRNNFKQSTTRHIEGGVSNYFNLSNATGEGGNYWDDFDQAAEGCNDVNGDGYCDSPRNSTIHASFTGQDNHPYKTAISLGAVANTPPPAPVLYSPTNQTITTSRTPTFVWNNSVDADNDPNISYRLEIDNSILFNNPEVNVTGIINTSNGSTSYTITTDLSVDTTFFWRVFAYDQTDYSTTANVGNFTVQSLLSVNITNDLVAFGTLANGANVSTPANANPFRGENVGNIVANITITGTPFFTAVSMPSTFYRFKIRANESGAFNTTASATEWNETNSTVNEFVFHVVNLDWHSISNDFLTDLNISVPGNESAGSKSSALTFTITG